MLASCTLEASLIGAAGVNGFGHALAAGFGHLLGHIGTPLAALALLAISLPWLIDFRWRDVAVWADGAFGLGLSRGLARRDEEARRHRSVDDGLPSHVSPATNTMAPKSNGRYARPTVWRPPAGGRGATAAGAAAGAATAKEATARGTAASWRAGAMKTRSQTAQAEPVLRTDVGTTPRQTPRPVPVRAQTPAHTPPLKADKAAWTPTEPVAPSGWLREPATTPRAPLRVRRVRRLKRCIPWRPREWRPVRPPVRRPVYRPVCHPVSRRALRPARVGRRRLKVERLAYLKEVAPRRPNRRSRPLRARTPASRRLNPRGVRLRSARRHPAIHGRCPQRRKSRRLPASRKRFVASRKTPRAGPTSPASASRAAAAAKTRWSQRIR